MGSLFSSSQRTQSTGTTNTNTSNNLNNNPAYQNFLSGFNQQYSNAGNFNVGLNDAQINSANNQQGVATNPGLGQGFNAAGNIAQNGFAGGIDAFNNPYQNNVIGAMQSDFARQNAEAQDARNAGAARSGALGNNTGRDALMARGAQDAQANALTQARFQGWNTSANLANQDAQARLSGANTIGNLTGAATNANTALNNMGRSNWQSEYQNERTPYDLYNQGMQGYQGAGNLAGTTSTGNTTGNSNTTSTPSFMQSLMGIAGMGMSGYNWGQGNGWWGGGGNGGGGSYTGGGSPSWRDGGAVKKGYNDGGSVIPPFHANGAAESFADKVARAHETVSKLRSSGGRTESPKGIGPGRFAEPRVTDDPWKATVRHTTDAEQNDQDPFWSPAQASRMVSWPPFRPMQYEMAELRGFDGGGMVLPPMMAPQGPPARPGMQGAPPMGGQGMVMPPFQPQGGPPAAPGSQGIPPMQQGAMPQRSAPQQGQFDPWSKGMPAGTQTPEHVASMLRGYDEGGSVLPEVMTPFPGFNQSNTTPMGPAFGGNPFAQFMPGMTPAPPAEPDVAGATLGPETTGQILPFGGTPNTSANIMEAYNPNGPPRMEAFAPQGGMVPTSGPGPVMDPNATTSDGGAGRRRGRTVSPNEEFAAMLLAASGPQVFGGAGEAALKNHQRRVSELNAELQADQLAQQLAHQNATLGLSRDQLTETTRHHREQEEVGNWMPRPDGSMINRKTGAVRESGLPTDVERRRAEAVAMGLDPGEPGFQQYVLTGKLGNTELNATQTNILHHAREGIISGQSTLRDINRALEINNNSYSGYGAAGRAGIVQNIPLLGGTESARDTRELSRLMTGQMLGNLRATFGGNPTEGERAVLAQVEGSVDATPEEREQILNRAKAALQARIRLQQENIAAIEGRRFTQARTAATPPAAGEVLADDPTAQLPAARANRTPPVPAIIDPRSQWSASLQIWKAPSGELYDADGRLIRE